MTATRPAVTIPNLFEFGNPPTQRWRVRGLHPRTRQAPPEITQLRRRQGRATMSAPARRNEGLRNEERWRPFSFADVACARGRLVSRLRRVFDLQAASIWRDLKSSLGEATGTVLDVGAGAQPYRPLINPGATYRAIDIADAGKRFGYEMPGTVYFQATISRWPIAPSTFYLRPRRSSTLLIPTPFWPKPGAYFATTANSCVGVNQFTVSCTSAPNAPSEMADRPKPTR